MCRMSSPYWPTRITHVFFLGGEGSCPAGKFFGEVARVLLPLTFGIFGNSTYLYEYFRKILPNMTSGKAPDVSGHSARDPALPTVLEAAPAAANLGARHRAATGR